MAARRPPPSLESFRSPIHGVAPSLTPPSATLLLIWSALAFIVLIGASVVLELDEVVTAPARIEPSSQVRHVQHYEGGTIREVLVREGDTVQNGDVLVRLVNSQGAQDLADRQSKWIATQARSARLSADLTGRSDIVWPPDIVIDAATKRRETNIHVERLAYRAQQLTVIRREIERRQREVAEAETKAAGLTRAQAKGGEEIRIKRKAHDVGVIGDHEIVHLEREQLMLDTETASAKGNIALLTAQLRETQAKESEFEKGWRSQVQDDIGKAEAELAGLKATMEVASDREARSEVRSPVKGIVKMAAITSVGQVARPGDTLMDIVPADDALVIEAKVAPQDIAQIRDGLPVSVRLSAYDQFRYGHLDGVVTMVGADAIDDVKGSMVSTYYRVLVVADHSSLTDSHGGRHAIRSGMVGSASIRVGRKSILRMVLDPLLRNDMAFSLPHFSLDWKVWDIRQTLQGRQ